MEKRIRLTGFGGQGIIMAGYTLGQAISIYDNRHAVFTQSYGPEARGSACSSQVVISDRPVLYPFVKKQDILLAMSQEGYDKFCDQMQEGGILIYDQDLVKFDKPFPRITYLPIPATQSAEKVFDRRIVANVIMLGFLIRSTKIATPEAMEKSVLKAAPKGTEELNKKALEFGLQYEVPKQPTVSKPKKKKEEAAHS
jgi:2-oxoglutarate ferredoxin oxidoreductase subunit gamma